jgi:4-amino-4-deoxy-L-arabinose transferase-like glycosyltransferase
MNRPATDPQAPPERLPAAWLAAIAVYGASLLLISPGRPWALTFHEVNFAQPAREFLAAGDWVVPRILGVPLWDKPPLMHWAIALSLGLFGTEAEWAARLPSVLSAVLVSCLIALLATRWHGRRIGLIAGLIQSSSFYVLMQGRLAEADMPLCAAVAAALTALAFGTIDGRSSGRRGLLLRLAYFGCAGLAFLTKGPLGLALVGCAGGLFAILERRRDVWMFLLDPRGWALMIALVIGWPAMALMSDSGLLETWYLHNVDRMSGRLGGQKDPFFYFYTIPWLFLPWTPFAIRAIRLGLRTRPCPSRAMEARFLGAWFIAGLLLLTLSAWKHKHYAIPLLPPLSIVAACGLDRFLASPPLRAIAWARLLSLALIVLGPFVGLGAWLASAPIVAGIGLTIAVGGLGLAVFSSPSIFSTRRSALVAAFGTVWCVSLLAQGAVLSRFDLYRGQADLARRTTSSLPAGTDLSVVEIPDPQIVYYLRLPLRRHDTWASFASRVQSDPASPRYIIAPARLGPEFSRLGLVRELDRSSQLHPLKPESERLTTFELLPDPLRLSSLRIDPADLVRR